MTMTKAVVTLCSILALTGCGVNEKGHYSLANTAQEESVAVPVLPSQVQLVAGAPRAIFTPLREIRVTVNKVTIFDETPDENAVRRALQEEAARIGANAVINVEISGPQISPLSWGARTGTGLAVKF